MAKLNEPLVSTDTLETLRRRMLRQNRELAKHNNVRALRNRELENECACMLSENLELRGRIIELEKQVEDSDSRRIADHAMAIKDKLETQLTEWATLLSGLGFEPPLKRHSPIMRKTSNSRLSFSATRSSPSQRRLRDVAKDIEELGHISETKAYPRRSMNPEQILALRSEADPTDSPDLGPPPTSHFIDEDPVKVDSPCRQPLVRVMMESPQSQHNPPINLPSPEPKKQTVVRDSPKKSAAFEIAIDEGSRSNVGASEQILQLPVKTGSKRKFASKETPETIPRTTLKSSSENVPPRFINNKVSVPGKPQPRGSRDGTDPVKETQTKMGKGLSQRQPLSSKSTNNEVSSPKKVTKPKTATSTALDKPERSRPKQEQHRGKPKPTNIAQEAREPAVIVDILPPAPAIGGCDADLPVISSVTLPPSPESPVATIFIDGPRGDTPPPADISSQGETSRPSRRNRTTVSYAEPNLRDKMRRPSKQLFDAVAGEGKYARRNSQCEGFVIAEADVIEDAFSSEELAKMSSDEDSKPTSPLAVKGSLPQSLPNSVQTDRRRRQSVTGNKETTATEIELAGGQEDGSEIDASTSMGDQISSSELDAYEISLSPQSEKNSTDRNGTLVSKRQSKPSRRVSTAVDKESDLSAQNKIASRRKSMMI